MGRRKQNGDESGGTSHDKKQSRVVPGVFQRNDRSWWARVVFTDPDTGLRRERVRRAINKTDAKAKRKDLLRDLEDHGPKLLDAYNMTFKDLADFYGKSYLVPAQYVDGRKIAGLRSLKTPKMFLRVL